MSQNTLGIYKNKKVFVGLSGGVDSAVSAHMLQKAGAHVTGVFIQGWYPPSMPCSWREDRRDAMRVAAYLNIPFHTLDASAEYKKGVIDYLISEYAEGRTPNPDTMCNRDVKFGAFYRYAQAHGVDFIATGHYARTMGVNGVTRLLRGIDAGKDQSYFLWAVPNDVLSSVVFPVGDMYKTDVRRYAEHHDLPVSTKKDSQGICFLGSVSLDDFLRSEIHPTPGGVFGTTGEHIGTHDGAVLYTLGERIVLQDGTPGPWYVIAKDMQHNTLTVSHTPMTTASRTEIHLRDTEITDAGRRTESLTAQYRYHGPVIAGRYDDTRHVFIPAVPLTEPLASGQSLVLFDGDVCLGGGIIV